MQSTSGIRKPLPKMPNLPTSPLQITPAANIWSYGVLLMELYDFGKQPYSRMSDEDVISRVLVTKSYLMEPPTFLYTQSTTRDKLYKLMLSCWNTVPQTRPTLPQIIHLLSTPNYLEPLLNVALINKSGIIPIY